LDCFGEIVPVSDHALRSQCMPNAKDVSTSAHSRTFAFRIDRRIAVYGNSIPRLGLERLIDCFHIPRTTGSTEVHRVCDFLDKFQNKSENRLFPKACSFHFILRLHGGQFQFYITDLELYCDDHARLILETDEISVPSFAANLCSEESCLKFARSLRCGVELSDEIMKRLGAAIRDWKQLRRIYTKGCKDSVCDLLEQVPNPSKCSLELGSWKELEYVCLTSAGAGKLASLLSRFKDISHLDLRFVDAEVDALITSITHKSLKELRLTGMILTPAAAAALGRSLPEMTSLEILVVETSCNQERFPTVDMDAMFGRFHKTLSLYELSLSGFSGHLAPLAKSFRFFPNLLQLNFEDLDMDELNLFVLLENLRFLPKLEYLRVVGKRLASADSSAAEVNTECSFTHETLKELILSGISLTPTVGAMLGQVLPKMPSLSRLQLFGQRGSVVPAEPMERLRHGHGCLVPLIRRFSSFPNLEWLVLENLNMDEHDLRSLLESFRFIPNLTVLSLSGNPFDHAVTSIVPHVTKLPKIEYLFLDGTGSREDLNSVKQALEPRVSVLIVVETFLFNDY